MADTFTLELLHIADQEGGAAAVQDAPRLSAVVNALKAQDLGADGAVDNTVFLSSGDAFIPGLFFEASGPVFGAGGIADIQIQNELGIQALALGNHEFDFGPRTLSELITGRDVTDDSEDDFIDEVPESIGSILGEEFAGAAFPYLSTNLNFASDEFLAPLEVAGGDAPQANTVTSSVIIDVNGESVGVVGATTPTLASISSAGDVGIFPSPFDTNPTSEQLDALAAVIQVEVDALLDANPELNKVVLLAHMQQLTIELGLAERLVNVDIIVAGGSNTRLLDENDRLRDGDSNQGEYPQFVINAGGTTTAVVNTDGSYKYVGRLVVDFDTDGNIIPESYDPNVSGAYATDAQGVADLGAEGLIDPDIQQIVDAIEAQIISTESNVLGVADVFLNGNRSGTDAAEDPDGVRTQETNLGNLTADANLAEAKAIDPSVVVSIKNGGGIRASIGETLVPPGGTEAVRTPNEAVIDSDGNVVKPEGGISQNDIQTTLAFNNGLTLLTLTKEELVAVLEHGVGALPGVAGAFPQVSGVKFSFDPDLPEGDRIQSAAIVDAEDNLIAELVRDGELVGDPSEAFRIVTLGFLASPRFDDVTGEFTGGGDGYPFPNTNLDPAVGEVGDADVVARVNIVQLEQEGITSGDALFADDGTEQDALAEYLLDNYSENSFDQEDTGRNLDERIQNLNFREDTVLGEAAVGPVTPPLVEESDFSDGFEGPFFKVAGIELSGGAEINAFDPVRQVAYVVSGGDVLQVIDLSDPSHPTPLFNIDVEAAAGVPIGGVNSVAYNNNVLALAVEAETVTDPGVVVLVDLETFPADPTGAVNALSVGALPDMVTFTPDGKKVLVANEGEPNVDYSVDPEGSVSIINLSNGVTDAMVETADFLAFNDQAAGLQQQGLKLIGPDGTTLAEEVEPEYIAVSPDGTTAWVTLQEANGIGVVDIKNGVITDILPLGFKDHSLSENPLDASNRDDGINIRNWPVFGTYQPDSIASYEAGGMTYYLTANEGDARIRPDGDFEDEDGNVLFEEGEFFNEEARVADLLLDPEAFPNAEELQLDENLGRLNVTDKLGDTDGDGDFDELYAYGARSFSIWDYEGNLVFDSGDDIARITQQLTPELFNANDGDPEEFDNRSDDKGAEPEALTVGQIGEKTYAFVGLERAGGGVLIYDITDPAAAEFVQYVRSDEDIAPEGLTFVSREDSPSGSPLLIVTNEESSTLAIYSTRNPIVSGGDSDRLIGTELPDSIVGLGSSGLINGLDGDDLLKGSNGDDTLKGSNGDDTLKGGNGDDLLNGGAGNDAILGGAGDDSILGGAGDDLITGGLGHDAITGGPGADTFVYESIGDAGDNIRLFELDLDKINIQPLLANSGIMVSDFEDAIAQGFLKVQVNNPRRASVLFDADGIAGGGDAVELTTVKVSSGMAAALSSAENFIV
jgi:2',3'-cyclic-nucleotide 2'-phosphodiesterase (5'-nucleotidase family)/Ca2+-binding RTX toxin-like protein